MANLSEMSRWEAGIYQWETSDPVQGGPNGIDNRPTRELANRPARHKASVYGLPAPVSGGCRYR